MSNDDKLWNFIADAAEYHIKKSASKSKLREDYAYIMSENRYRNKEFEQLVTDACSCVHNLERKYARQNDKPEDWLTEGTEAFVDGHFAYSVISDRRISDQLTDREYNDMKAAAEDLQDLMSRNERSSYRRDDRREPGRERSMHSMGSRDLGRASRGAVHTGRQSDRGAAGASGWDALSNLGAGGDTAREVNEPAPAREERYVVPTVEAALTPRQETRQEPRQHINIEGPDYRETRPYDRFMRHGEEWVLAALSTWKLTGDGDLLTVVPKLYNCNTHIKYHVKDTDGKVREEFDPVTEDNRYAAHENLHRAIDEPVPPKAASSGFTRAALQNNLNEGISGEFLPQKETLLHELLQDVDPDQFDLRRSNPVDSITGAVFSSRAALTASKDRARVDLHLLRTPIVASKPGQIDLIEKVYNTNSLAGTQEMLNTLKPEFDQAVWGALNKRLGDFLLRAATYQFQFNEVTKLNFSKHYIKYLGDMENLRGAEPTAMFAQRIGYVCDLATGHFAEADVADYTSDLYELKEGETVPMVSFVDFIAMVSLDCTLDDLGIGSQLDDQEKGAVVQPTGNRKLYDALRSLYGNLDGKVPAPGKVRIYLSTSDNRLIEVLPYAARTDAFILAAV